MECLKQWITLESARQNIPPEEANLAMLEVDMNVISVKGWGIFPITYSMLAGVS